MNFDTRFFRFFDALNDSPVFDYTILPIIRLFLVGKSVNKKKLVNDFLENLRVKS